MLSPAERDLTRRNQEIPGLATVLDPEAFLAALREAIPHADVEAARIHSIKLEPRTYCRVAYGLEVGGKPLDLDARACRPEDLDAWIRESGATDESGPLGSDHIVFAEQAVLVTAFPSDPKLTALRELMDAKARRRLLRALLPERDELWSGELRTLRYRPGRRYVAELRGPGGARVLLKASTAKGHHRACRNAAAFRSSSPLRIARLLGADDRHGLLAYEWLPGTALFDLWSAPRMNTEAVATAGAALAELHAQSPDGLDRWTREAVVADLAAAASEIGFVCPWLARRAGDLARRLSPHVAAAPVMRTTLHGDFSSRHVLVEGGEAGIVDLDWACRGDPADDLGSILAQVERHVVSDGLPHDRVGRFRHALIGGYGTKAGIPERIDLFTAVELFRGARFPFRRSEPEWPERTGHLLRRAEAMAEALGEAHAAGTTRSAGREVG
jgi:aminoglycoside phosphotransferase (APT) family kinase protein